MTLVDPNITEETPFTEADDQYHRLGDDNPFNLETNWWSFNIPERRIGCWVHAAYYQNTDMVRWRILVWDDKGHEPSRAAYYKNVEVPIGKNPDLRDITYPGGGYSLKMLKPAMDYWVGYSDPDRRFALDFEHRSVHPPHRFTPGEAPAMHNPHFDQLGRIVGTLTLNGEQIPIDCYSVRDRTWGPREGAHASSQKAEYLRGEYKVRDPGGPRWREIERERGRGRLQYIFGHAGAETGFLSFVRPQDGDARGWSPLNMGWLLKDGKFVRLDKTKSKMKTWRNKDTGFSDHMEVLLVDRSGRTMEAEGMTLSSIAEYGSGPTASLMRWEFEGKIGWGEDQDGWKNTEHFTKMMQALRDTKR